MNKNLVYAGIGIAAALVAYGFWTKMKKGKSTEKVDNIPNELSDKEINEIQKTVIGKKAYAIENNTKVRSGAVVNDGTINNIVGVLNAGDEAGVIDFNVRGLDGKMWFHVKRSSVYACDFGTCGITIPRSTGYVRSDVVKVK